MHAHPDAALIGVCHTFGVMSRWLGVADPVLRGPEKGGKSAGIVDSVLTPASAAHPWFGGLARGVADEPGHAGRSASSTAGSTICCRARRWPPR